MKTTTRSSLRALVWALVCSVLICPVCAQIPDTLLQTMLPERKGLQIDAQLGYSAALSGGFAVLGTPNDYSNGTQGVVKVFDAATGALRLVLHSPNPAIDGSFGCAVTISGTRLVVGAMRTQVNDNSAGAVYVYDLAGMAPSIPLYRFDNPQGTDEGNFGIAVAISGSRIIVGADANNSGGRTEAGNAYIYDLEGADPTVPVAVLDDPNPTPEDNFGEAVAIEGTRVAVGTPDKYYDGDGSMGTVDVYDLAGAAPTVPVITFRNPLGLIGDAFGLSVSVSGSRILATGSALDAKGNRTSAAFIYDLTGATPNVPVTTLPGTGLTMNSAVFFGTKVLVGNRYDATGAQDAGSAYVYDPASATPATPVLTLHNPSPAVGDYFGWAVATDGTRILVSAPYDDTGAIDGGSGYVYDSGSASPTVPVAVLNSPGAATDAQFGAAVAVSGKFMVVGAPLNDVGGQDAGSAFIYDLSSVTPTAPVLELDNPSPLDTRYFGSAVAISGNRVLVAEPYGAYPNRYGEVYVYDLGSGTPTVPITRLAKPLPLPGHHPVGDRFGFSVGISGTRVVVGSPNDDFQNPVSIGAAYAFDLSSAAPTVPIQVFRGLAGPYAEFGDAVAISGSRVVVGFPNASVVETAEGSAYIFDLNSATPAVPVTILANPDPAFADFFGSAVAASGERVIVGSPNDSTGAPFAGSAYVYDFSHGLPRKPLFTLHNPTPVAGEEFGSSVAISGSLAVVASVADSVGGISAGSACVYDLNGATPTTPAVTLDNPHPAIFDIFGSAVAIDGTTVAVGAPGDDTVRPNQGAIYVYGPNPVGAPPAPGDGLLNSWKLTHFGTTAGHGPLEDDDHDGLNNLLEEAFGADPLKPDVTAVPVVANEGGYLTMTILKHPGVTYEVQSGASSDPAAFSAATTTALVDDATLLKVRDNFPIGTTPGRFMRVKVTAAP